MAPRIVFVYLDSNGYDIDTAVKKHNYDTVQYKPNVKHYKDLIENKVYELALVAIDKRATYYYLKGFPSNIRFNSLDFVGVKKATSINIDPSVKNTQQQKFETLKSVPKNINPIAPK